MYIYYIMYIYEKINIFINMIVPEINKVLDIMDIHGIKKNIINFKNIIEEYNFIIIEKQFIPLLIELFNYKYDHIFCDIYIWNIYIFKYQYIEFKNIIYMIEQYEKTNENIKYFNYTLQKIENIFDCDIYKDTLYKKIIK